MRSDHITAIVLFVPLMIIQFTIIPFISFNQIAPDLVLVLLVFYTLKLGQLQGTILGSVYGLLFDIFSGGILGSAMFSKTLAGFITGYFYNENKIDYNLTSFMFLVIVLIVGSVDSIAYSFFSTADINTNLIPLFFEQGILPGLYSAMLALPMIIFTPKKIFT
jgi:rod shape-determining protein MreD